MSGLPGACVYDPEDAGSFIRKSLPLALRLEDFQDYPLWRACVREQLCYIAERWPGPIIVPMTITNRGYWDEIVGSLSARWEVRPVILCAERETLLRRLASRGEGKRSWAARQIDRCLRAFDGEMAGDAIQTDDLTIPQVVESIAAAVGVPLAADRRGPLRRRWDRFLTLWGHIR